MRKLDEAIFTSVIRILSFSMIHCILVPNALLPNFSNAAFCFYAELKLVLSIQILRALRQHSIHQLRFGPNWPISQSAFPHPLNQHQHHQSASIASASVTVGFRSITLLIKAFPPFLSPPLYMTCPWLTNNQFFIGPRCPWGPIYGS